MGGERRDRIRRCDKSYLQNNLFTAVVVGEPENNPAVDHGATCLHRSGTAAWELGMSQSEVNKHNALAGQQVPKEVALFRPAKNVEVRSVMEIRVQGRRSLCPRALCDSRHNKF